MNELFLVPYQEIYVVIVMTTLDTASIALLQLLQLCDASMSIVAIKISSDRCIKLLQISRIKLRFDVLFRPSNNIEQI